MSKSSLSRSRSIDTSPESDPSRQLDVSDVPDKVLAARFNARPLLQKSTTPETAMECAKQVSGLLGPAIEVFRAIQVEPSNTGAAKHAARQIEELLVKANEWAVEVESVWESKDEVAARGSKIVLTLTQVINAIVEARNELAEVA